MQRLALGKTYGGGPSESLIRLLNQQNVVSELNPGLGRRGGQDDRSSSPATA